MTGYFKGILEFNYKNAVPAARVSLLREQDGFDGAIRWLSLRLSRGMDLKKCSVASFRGITLQFVPDGATEPVEQAVSKVLQDVTRAGLAAFAAMERRSLSLSLTLSLSLSGSFTNYLHRNTATNYDWPHGLS
jgi:hypothetical protein